MSTRACVCSAHVACPHSPALLDRREQKLLSILFTAVCPEPRAGPDIGKAQYPLLTDLIVRTVAETFRAGRETVQPHGLTLGETEAQTESPVQRHECKHASQVGQTQSGGSFPGTVVATKSEGQLFHPASCLSRYHGRKQISEQVLSPLQILMKRTFISK